MKICLKCYVPYWGKRRKFCSDACYGAHRQAYQRAYQQRNKRAKQARETSARAD